MRRILPHVAVLLVYLMTPSAGEIVENVVHLLTKGHTAHAIEDDAHEPDGAEHGCSGPFHFCPCHSSSVFTAPLSTVEIGSPGPTETELGLWYEDAASEGHPGSVFRPPIA